MKRPISQEFKRPMHTLRSHSAPVSIFAAAAAVINFGRVASAFPGVPPNCLSCTRPTPVEEDGASEVEGAPHAGSIP